ncbi:MAG: hypothetical protein NWF06_02010 [Candidatus Bathyarchaeota archaeon]|nr:hypothetical protein [Candidatus Bathyarchaeum sp.]
MTEPKFYSPLKIGFIIVVLAYFLFTFHAMFTLSWIGEWEAFSGSFRLVVFVQDVSANIGIAARLIASAIAFIGVILYFVKKGLSKQTTTKVLRMVLFGEAIYWLGLLAAGVLPLFYTLGFDTWRVNGHVSVLPFWLSLLMNQIPLLIQSIAIPAVLLKVVFALKPNKPAKQAIKWGLIAATVYIFVFWLTNTAEWARTIIRQGTVYLTSYPQNLLCFALTSIGLLALTVFMVYFTKKSMATETLEKLDLQPISAVIILLGLFYLWNYLSWIFFGIDQIWSNWYVWFLSNNLNLWMLSIPFVGLPLFLNSRSESMRLNQKFRKLVYATQGVGAVFVAVFLMGYLGGLPSRDVLHSEPVFKVPLIIFGATLLLLIIVTAIMIANHRKNRA